jgi:hypothetical protein
MFLSNRCPQLVMEMQSLTNEYNNDPYYHVAATAVVVCVFACVRVCVCVCYADQIKSNGV